MQVHPNELSIKLEVVILVIWGAFLFIYLLRTLLLSTMHHGELGE